MSSPRVSSSRSNRKDVELFKKRGADLRPGKGLLTAILDENIDIIETLLEEGAYPTVKNNIILIMAAQATGEKSLRYLLNQGFRKNIDGALIVAISLKDIKKIRLLVEHGADVNYVSGIGTPYQMALRANNREMMAYLYAAGATPFTQEGPQDWMVHLNLETRSLGETCSV